MDSIALLSLYASTVYQRKANENFVIEFSELSIEDFETYTNDLIECFGRSVDKAIQEEYKYISFPGVGAFRRSDIRRKIVEFKRSCDGDFTKDDIKQIIKEQVEIKNSLATKDKPTVLLKKFNETQENNL